VGREGERSKKRPWNQRGSLDGDRFGGGGDGSLTLHIDSLPPGAGKRDAMSAETRRGMLTGGFHFQQGKQQILEAGVNGLSPRWRR